jgi:hypothetical protein
LPAALPPSRPQPPVTATMGQADPVPAPAVRSTAASTKAGHPPARATAAPTTAPIFDWPGEKTP